MGNWLNLDKPDDMTNKHNECIFCSKLITDKTCIKCILCDMTCHIQCEELYRKHKDDNFKYCECPNSKCKKIGTLCFY